MSVRIVYRDVAVGADADAAMTATGATAPSDVSLLPFGSGNAAAYATLEYGQWVLDGSRRLYGGEAVSFWSEGISGADGYFSAPPTVTATMDENYSSMGITLDFGAYDGCFCSEVRLTWYQGDTVLAEETFYPDTVRYYCERTVEAYNRLRVEFVRTNLPYTRARLDTLIFGITREFLRNELRSVTVTQEADISSRELAANALDWALSSREVIDFMFQRQQAVSVYDSDTLIGVFYVTSSTRKGERHYNITCTDAVGVLDEESFPDAVYTGKNALELAREICAGFAVQMDAALQTKTVTGILSKCTRRQALQQLCFAIGAIADTSGSEYIKIFALPEDNPAEIGANRTRLGGTISRETIVTAVKVTAHSYSATASEGDSVEINGVRYYDTTSSVTIENPNVIATDKANVIEVADATLVSHANVNDVAQRLYNYTLRRITHNLRFRLDGEVIGDCVTTVTPWMDAVTGNLRRMSIIMSGIAVADAEVVGL